MPPTHPELLDYLAAKFVREGWSVKKLHREILLSRVYRLSSDDREENLAADPNNDYLWRSDRRRLDAETIRDTLLALGGNLDTSRAGPHPFPPSEKWGYTQHYPFKDEYPTDRRSVYRLTKRLNAVPFFVTFDGADCNASTPKRDSSVTTVQALYLLNDPFVHAQSARFAARLLREASDPEARLARAFALALGRPPRDEERSLARAFLDGARAKFAASGATPDDAERRAWESYARVMFRLNEFIYVD